MQSPLLVEEVSAPEESAVAGAKVLPARRRPSQAVLAEPQLAKDFLSAARGISVAAIEGSRWDLPRHAHGQAAPAKA